MSGLIPPTSAVDPGYDFDVAVSFAGEDREFVEEAVGRLKAEGIRVFYDTDYQAALWGEDLVDYLDRIYRLQARYTMMFISQFYVEKMWTNHERRSALARALQQRTAYVLPVRLDSAEVPGLQPTVGYLDARILGVDGIVNATIAKLKGSPPAKSAAILRVPRTEAERQRVLLDRPRGWEYLYFAGQLLHERNSVEGKYRDHSIYYARSTGEVVAKADVVSFMRMMMNDAQRLSGKMSILVNNEAAMDRAMGPPGVTGDPDMIAHLAMRWNSSYEEFLDWAARLRGASVASNYHGLFESLAQYADGPIEQYRNFVDEYVKQIDKLPGFINSGRQLKFELQLIVSIPEAVVKAYNAEFDRVKDQLKRDLNRP